MGKPNVFFNYLKFFDIFGVPIQIYLNRKAKFTSAFGAIISLFVLAISFYFLVKQFISWYNLEAANIISSIENTSAPSLVNDNRTIEYNFDHKNYLIYFSINAWLQDSSVLSYKELNKYLDIKYYYTVDWINIEMLESEDCNIREINEFLNLAYDENELPENATNHRQMCIKAPMRMGMFPNLEMSDVEISTFMMQIRKCQNTTENNNSCAPIEEIQNNIKYVTVQATIPNTVYDFKNQSSPVKRTYKYEFYSLDLRFSKIISTNLNPTFLYKDYGLFDDDYRIDSINFNPGQQNIDFNSVNEDDPILFNYQLWISDQKNIYYMKNQKLNDIFGNFGGTTSVLFSIGSYICMSINEFLYINSLLNVAFKFNLKKKGSSVTVISKK